MDSPDLRRATRALLAGALTVGMGCSADSDRATITTTTTPTNPTNGAFPCANPRDAVWQEYGGEYQSSGRTKLQFDCGG